jgi:hypothetical protein
MKKSILSTLINKHIKPALPTTPSVRMIKLSQAASDLGHVLGSPFFTWPKVIGEV